MSARKCRRVAREIRAPRTGVGRAPFAPTRRLRRLTRQVRWVASWMWCGRAARDRALVVFRSSRCWLFLWLEYEPAGAGLAVILFGTAPRPVSSKVTGYPVDDLVRIFNRHAR